MNQYAAPLFTVLLPTNRNADMLKYVIESVLAQTLTSFELFIICDGAPSDTIISANEFAKNDSRIRVFIYPKGLRMGETHRHTALSYARGDHIAGIGDDDLWFPNHLEEMIKLLQEVDFGNLFQTEVDIDGRLFGHRGDLSCNRTVKRMLDTKFNFFGPTVCGYKRSAYQKLQIGWSPAPDDIWSDLYMWRKFLSTKDITYKSRIAVTSLHFANSLRISFSTEERKKEISHWASKIKSSVERETISQDILKTYANSTIKNETSKVTHQISVIIPIFNGIHYLKTAVDSVICQTILPCELILVDDGSTDDSIKSVEGIETPFPIRIFQQKNAGQSSARNHGAKIAKGDFLAFLDQDDVWYPAHLEKLIEPFSRVWRLGWTYSNLDEIDESGSIVQIDCLDLNLKEHPKKNIVKMLGQDVFILPSASLILKKAFQEISGFDERLCVYEDDDLFIRLFEANWKNYYVAESLSQWRIYSNSTSFSEKMEISRLIYAEKLVAKYQDKPLLNRLWASDLIIPKFLRMTIQSYFFYCIKVRDLKRCKSLLTQFHNYIALLPKNRRKKWNCYAFLLSSPRLIYLIWDNFILYLPSSFKKMLRSCLIVSMH